jgi:hypothetical protein
VGVADYVGVAEADLNIDSLDAATLWKVREFCDGALLPERLIPRASGSKAFCGRRLVS